MSNTKFRQKYDVINAETLGADFATSMTLATAGATIPANAGEVYVFSDEAFHWTPNGTATTTFAHAVAANEPVLLSPSQVGTAEFIADATTMIVRVVYMRGSGRQDAAYTAQTRPF